MAFAFWRVRAGVGLSVVLVGRHVLDLGDVVRFLVMVLFIRVKAYFLASFRAMLMTFFSSSWQW